MSATYDHLRLALCLSVNSVFAIRHYSHDILAVRISQHFHSVNGSLLMGQHDIAKACREHFCFRTKCHALIAIGISGIVGTIKGLTVLIVVASAFAITIVGVVIVAQIVQGWQTLNTSRASSHF